MTEKKQKIVVSEKKEGIGEIRFDKINYLLLSLGILSIALGYLTLSKGSITLAPILLVIGYCVFVPFGIVIRRRKDSTIDKSVSKNKELDAG